MSKKKKEFLPTFKKVLEERIPKDLKVKLESLEYSEERRFDVTLSGDNKDNLIFVSNILKELTGEEVVSHKVTKQQVLWGKITALGKVGFGIFIEAGVIAPAKDILVPLFTLRKQLPHQKGATLQTIIKDYGFMDYLPVEIVVTKIEYEKGGNPKFEAEFTERYLQMLENWILNGFDIVFTSGASRQLIKRTIAKRGHTIDVLEIIRLGPLEMAVVCKKGTRGPGIISHIGQFLPDCKFTTLQPHKLAKLWK